MTPAHLSKCRVALLIALACSSLVCSPSAGGEKPKTAPKPKAEAKTDVPAPEAKNADAEWPQFRGPNRDGVSAETGLLKQWPDGGPKLLWSAKGCGLGFASVSIADGLIYTAGNVGGDMNVVAFTLKGKRKWQARVGKAFDSGNLTGSRATPTIDGDRLYYETPHGDVVCLKAKTGEPVWSLNMRKKFGAQGISWAYSESVLIDGDNAIIFPGGRQIGVVALDKQTGRTVWTCEGTGGDKTAYCSPIIVEQGGLRQIVGMTAKAAVGINAETGKLLWRFEHPTKYGANVPNPIYHNGRIFICSGYGQGSVMLKLKVSGKRASVTKLWSERALDNHHGGVVLVDGYIYGTSSRVNWVCLDWNTGEVKFNARERGRPRIGKGSFVYADGMFYCFGERKGPVGLAKATPSGFSVISAFTIPGAQGQSNVWAHPVVCDGRLYIRFQDTLFAYDIKAR